MKNIILVLFIIVSALVLFYLVSILFAAGGPFSILNDPFGGPSKRVSENPNCGPEYRYKFDVTIDSKDSFVGFIKYNKIDEMVQLDDFKDVQGGEVNWNRVKDSVKVKRIWGRTIYSIEYIPLICQGVFILKMTNDGHVSLYGCCGF